MYVGRDFDDMDVGENEVFALDFVRELSPGEVALTSIWSCKVLKGKDAQAAACIDGAAQVHGTRSLQRISGLKAGVTYVLRADVQTNQGNTKSLWARVTCVDPTKVPSCGDSQF